MPKLDLYFWIGVVVIVASVIAIAIITRPTTATVSPRWEPSEEYSSNTPDTEPKGMDRAEQSTVVDFSTVRDLKMYKGRSFVLGDDSLVVYGDDIRTIQFDNGIPVETVMEHPNIIRGAPIDYLSSNYLVSRSKMYQVMNIDNMENDLRLRKLDINNVVNIYENNEYTYVVHKGVSVYRTLGMHHVKNLDHSTLDMVFGNGWYALTTLGKTHIYNDDHKFVQTINGGSAVVYGPTLYIKVKDRCHRYNLVNGRMVESGDEAFFSCISEDGTRYTNCDEVFTIGDHNVFRANGNTYLQKK